MRHITAALFLSLALPTVAQVTIGQNEMPHAGDALLRTQATNIFVNYGATGANYTWNFANLVASAQDTRNYQTVASTNFVYALIYVDLGFNPNRANHATEGVDIPFNQILPIANPFTFYLHTASQYKKVGYGAEVSGIPVPITMTQQDVVYQLPLEYGDQSTSQSAYELNVPNLAYYGYSQLRTNEVDGWGAITTPAGTYDVLRVHTILEGRDSINLDTIGLGFAIERPVAHEYKWLAPGFRVPILQINTTEILGTEVVSGIWFYDEPRSIDVVAPLAATLCNGISYTLSYNENGSYNPGGFLVPSNVFTAQLSDASGSFANPVNIGSVQSTQSGTITITIPANTPAGTGYRIRVNANSPATTGNDNGFDITIAPGSLPVATASAGGPTLFCDGGDVLLSATATPGYTYQWAVDGNTISGATDPDLLVAAGGAYTVVATNECGADTSTSITVAVNPLPEHLLDQPSYFACQGASATITGVDQSGLTTLAYQWSLNGNALVGETAVSTAATVAGSYALTITDTLTGCDFTTTDGVLQIGAVPTVSITPAGGTTFCDGGSVVLDAGNDPSLTYQWSLDGTAITGADASTWTADSTGSYSVVVTNGDGCSSDGTAAVAVTENPLPTTPVITQGSDTLYASGSGDFQWFLFGSPVSGATDAFIETATSGDYTVTVTDPNGCSSTSAAYTYIATGIDANATGTFAVYPNPTNGLVTIQLASAPTTSDRFDIFDAAGKCVISGPLTTNAQVVDLSAQAPGLYTVRVLHSGAQTLKRLAKN